MYQYQSRTRQPNEIHTQQQEKFPVLSVAEHVFVNYLQTRTESFFKLNRDIFTNHISNIYMSDCSTNTYDACEI